MEYHINLLGEKYAEYLENTQINISRPKADIDPVAYNDLEYLDTIKGIQSELENVDDLDYYEKFLKGE